MFGSSSTSKILGMAILLLINGWKVHDEARVISLFALDRDRPAEFTDNAKAQAQAETCSAFIPSGSEERIENFIQVFLLDANAFIKKFKAQTLPPRFVHCPCLDLKNFLLRVLGPQGVMSIANHIDDDLTQTRPFGAHRW